MSELNKYLITNNCGSCGKDSDTVVPDEKEIEPGDGDLLEGDEKGECIHCGSFDCDGECDEDIPPEEE